MSSNTTACRRQSPGSADPKSADPKSANRRPSVWRRVALITAVASVTTWHSVTTWPTPAQAQEPAWRTLPLPNRLVDDRSVRQDIKTRKQKVLTRQNSLSDSQAHFDGWYERWLFPLMTQIEPVVSEKTKEKITVRPLAEIPQRRQKLYRDFRSCKDDAVHKHLNSLTLSMMLTIVRPDEDGTFHPAVRHNAMLIIGDLNEREGSSIGSNRGPPDPYAAALPILLEEVVNPKRIDAVRSAALVGLLRHAKMDRFRDPQQRWDQANRAKIFESVMPLASSQQPPEGRSLAGHTWMRRRAVEILWNLDAALQGDELISLLDQIAGGTKESLALRADAAHALGRITLPPTLEPKAASLAGKLAGIAVESCMDEVLRIQARLDEEAADALKYEEGLGGRRQPGVAMSPFGGDRFNLIGPDGEELEEEKPADPRNDLSRRNLKSRLYNVHIGLVGIDIARTWRPGAPSASSKQQKDVDAVVNLVNLSASSEQREDVGAVVELVEQLLELCDDGDAEPKDWMASIAEQGSQLAEVAIRLGAQLGAADEPAIAAANVAEADDLAAEIPDEPADLPEDIPEEPAG